MNENMHLKSTTQSVSTLPLINLSMTSILFVLHTKKPGVARFFARNITLPNSLLCFGK